MPDKIKTYVLVGYGNDLLGGGAYKSLGDVEVIEYEPGVSITEVAKKIKPPANIILQFHGGNDGTFTWTRKQHEKLEPFTPYIELISKLPRSGIECIMLGSCYGGIVMDERYDAILRAVPSGCLVLSMISAKTINFDNISTQFAKESKGLLNPVDLYLEALDNFHPVRYREFTEYTNTKNKDKTKYTTDPQEALPHMLGIGGNPPLRIDLNEEMKRLKPPYQTTQTAMARAIIQVQARFDMECIVTKVNEQGQKLPNEKMLQNENWTEHYTRKQKKALDDRIAAMAAKLQRGEMPKGAEEKRLAYAITAAYLDQSGQLKSWVTSQPGYVDYQTEQARKNARLHELGIHTVDELENYIKEANAGCFMGVFGKGIDAEERKIIEEAGLLLGQKVVIIDRPGDKDQISLPTSPLKSKMNVTFRE